MAGQDFEAFFGRHYDPVARALTLATGSRDLAEEATQDAFTKALRHWRKVRSMDRPDGWVYVVGMNAARDRARYLADLSLAEVADAMGCALGTVKATLHQAMGALRVELEEDDDAN